MIRPLHQRELRGLFVPGPVVDAGNPCPVAAVVIKARFDNMRLDADVGHSRGDGPADVVNPPRLHEASEASVELLLALAPRHEGGARAVTKQMIAVALRDRADDLKRRRRQCYRVRAMILAAFGRQRPRAGIEIEFTPAQTADLLAPAAEQDQQADDATVIVVAAGAPDRGQLGIAQDPIAGLRLLRPARADDRVALRPSLLHRPA